MHVVCLAGSSTLPEQACIDQQPAYSFCCHDSKLGFLQGEDPDVGVVLCWLEQDTTRLPCRHLRASLAFLKKLWTESYCPSIVNGLLFESTLFSTIGERQVQAVVPSAVVP